MIPLEKEEEEFFKQTGVYENCYFCKVGTDMWHKNTNQPVCTDCAKIHKVSELPKAHPDYKPQ